jgi:F-type H+-transporting ATPase subunit b
MNEEFWLLVALIIVIALLWRPAKPRILGALDARGDRIRRELEEATRLREEAEVMLAEQRTRLGRAEERTREILAHAEAETERRAARMHTELEAALNRRTELAMDRIAREEARALQEVRAQAAGLAMRATRRLLAEGLDQSRQRTMTDDAIAEIGRKLH